MPTFKVIGDDDVTLTDEVGELTQGIGFPIVPVDKTSGGTVQVGDPTVVVTDISGRSFVNQNPTGLGMANQIQVNFGAAQAPYLDANGTYTAQETGQRTFAVSVNAARSINGGEAYLWFYASVNGGATGSHLFVIDNTRSYWNFSFTLNEDLTTGDTVKFYLFRQLGEHDDGGLVSAVSGEPVPPTPSAFLEVTRTVIS